MGTQTRKRAIPSKVLSSNLHREIEKLETLLKSPQNSRLTVKQRKKQKQFAKQLLNQKKTLVARLNRTLKFANVNPVRYFSKNEEPGKGSNTEEPTVNSSRKGMYMKSKTRTRRIFSSNLNRKLWEVEKSRKMKEFRKVYEKQVAAQIAHNEHMEKLAERHKKYLEKHGK